MVIPFPLMRTVMIKIGISILILEVFMKKLLVAGNLGILHAQGVNRTNRPYKAILVHQGDTGPQGIPGTAIRRSEEVILVIQGDTGSQGSAGRFKETRDLKVLKTYKVTSRITRYTSRDYKVQSR